MTFSKLTSLPRMLFLTSPWHTIEKCELGTENNQQLTQKYKREDLLFQEVNETAYSGFSCRKQLWVYRSIWITPQQPSPPPPPHPHVMKIKQCVMQAFLLLLFYNHRQSWPACFCICGVAQRKWEVVEERLCHIRGTGTGKGLTQGRVSFSP